MEEYSTELQDLGQHVEYKETPVRVIKITKTVAVKVPVPYPVKVIEKVPYPVHVAKPYPVSVPQIVRVPHDSPAHAHAPQPQPAHVYGDHSYNVHENPPSDDQSLHSFSSGQLGGKESGYTQTADEHPHEYDASGSYDAPSGGSLYGYANKDDSGSSYDAAIQHYHEKKAGKHNAGAPSYGYY